MPVQSVSVPVATAALSGVDAQIHRSLDLVQRWVESHGYQAYEPFDGLSSPLRRFTFGSLFLERLLQQSVRQSAINIRPLVGVRPQPSTKGRGYMVMGYLGLHRLTGDPAPRQKALDNLEWLIAHKSPKFAEFSWANHFDYASRGGRYSKHESIIVWTSLIGQAFLDAYEFFGDARYLDVAASACRWILGLPQERTATGICLSYHMLEQNSVHNASMLGAALLARTWRHTGMQAFRDLATAAMTYSCTRQLPDGSWWYGEDRKYHWIDNFHTGYNLDSLKCYIDNTEDGTFAGQLERGYAYFERTFFEPSGRPRYYDNRAQPIDIQCSSQAIETLVKFADHSPDAIAIATRVATWTIENMQDADGHFYYRKYPILIAKAPMLHWGQATMFHALVMLLARRQAALGASHVRHDDFAGARA